MKVVVIGLGSMGKRRIRLLQRYDHTMQIFGVDKSEKRRKETNEVHGIETFNTLTDLLNENKIDYAFVCTSPLSHHTIITDCLNQDIHVFTELNLVHDGYERNINLAKKKDLVLFISSTFLYREEIKKIKSLVQESNGLHNYTYHVGQYLPDWHPWEHYNDFFVGDKRTNGCREIFAIELPWLVDVFGDITNVEVVKGKNSSLTINYNDHFLAIVEHTSGHKGTLAVDVVSRKAVRNLEVFGEQLYLSWNGSPKGLKVYDYEKKVDVVIDLYKEIDQLENYSHFVVENAYYNEITAFFESVNNQKKPIYSFEKDREILKLIDMIEA